MRNHSDHAIIAQTARLYGLTPPDDPQAVADWLDSLAAGSPHDRAFLSTCPAARRIVDARSAAAMPVESSGRFVRVAELADATLRLASDLPGDVAGVCGIPRSGMIPASLLACHLHLPLYSLSASGRPVDVGAGYRLTHSPSRVSGRLVIVDDTIHNGGTMDAARRKYDGPTAIWAAIYARPEAAGGVDMFSEHLPTPHMLEWNLWNCPWSAHLAVDFDGILCFDFFPEDDDDGPRYLAALVSRRPRYLPRATEIPLIVTARLEKYRRPTLDWLDAWGIRVSRLAMGPWSSIAERGAADVAGWKNEQIASYSGEIPLSLYIESDAGLARAMAAAGCSVPILCPELGLLGDPSRV